MALIFVNRYFYPDISATSQMLSDLAMHMADAGMTVRVITSRQRLTDANARLPAREQVHGVDVYRVWTTRFGRHSLPGRAVDYLSFHCSVLWVLLRVLRAQDQVVAATDPPLLGVGVAIVATLRRARLINWLHDIFPETALVLGVPGIRRWVGAILLALRDWSLRVATVNVAIGERMAKLLHSRGIPADSVRVIHNWSDGQAILPVAANDNPLRDEWGLHGKFVVGYSGNIGRAHRLEILPALAARFMPCEDVVFLVIGDGAGLPSLRRSVRARGLTNVIFKPYQPRVQLAFSLGVIDVHLISLHPQLEGLIVPSKVYGVLAAGRASVFLGDVDGEVARLLLDSETGFACAIEDEDSLFDDLNRLREDEQLLEQMGQRARQMFCAHFDKKHAMEKWLHVLGFS
ncbi:MAG: colanic acid biosynthesis glycosyl transferase WcaI [Gammaproteobacteria bacterium]|jgi:colanic acid biosynthesis glycosyl transferase WcaI